MDRVPLVRKGDLKQLGDGFVILDDEDLRHILSRRHGRAISRHDPIISTR
jgi:hypothetical protein